MEKGLATIRRAQEVAADLDDSLEVSTAMLELTGALLLVGHYAEAAARGMEAETYASKHGLGGRQGTLAMILVAQALDALGRWEDATAALARALQYEHDGFIEIGLQTRILLFETRRGHFESASRRAERVRHLADRFADFRSIAAVAERALWLGDPLAARSAVRDAVAAFDRDRGRGDVKAVEIEGVVALGLRAEADLADLARSGNATAESSESDSIGGALLGRMRSLVEDPAMSHPLRREETAWLATAEAEFSRLQNTPDPDRWAAAAVTWDAAGFQFHRSYALMREAQAALGLRRDRPRAAEALIEGKRIADGLDAIPLKQMIESIAGRAGIVLELPTLPIGEGDREVADRTGASRSSPERIPTHTRNTRGRDELTQRELEVLVLLVEGHSDGEIGERLFISKKTVSVHVTRIKGKLGARSRVEIATDAARQGLVDLSQLKHT